MLIREAIQITGGLSSPSKMPTKAYSLPAGKCKTGGRLKQIKGTVCSECYACKGRFMFKATQNAMERRFNSLRNKDWKDAMVVLISNACKKIPYFRWHDSGDLQGTWHLENIIEIARRLPEIKFWLPTTEHEMVLPYMQKLPENLNIRLTSHFIDKLPKTQYTSAMVYAEKAPKGIHICQATLNHTTCGNCRACWNTKISAVGYSKH